MTAPPDKIDRIESVLLILSDETAHLASEVRALGTEVKALGTEVKALGTEVRALGTEVRTGFAEMKEVATRQERSIDRLVGIVEILIQRQEK
jgi:outer membrane murein-binding lipoprotein Lpp